jgi:hypothetical protein
MFFILFLLDDRGGSGSVSLTNGSGSARLKNIWIRDTVEMYKLYVSVADPDPGSGIGCFLTPGSGIRDPE